MFLAPYVTSPWTQLKAGVDPVTEEMALRAIVEAWGVVRPSPPYPGRGNAASVSCSHCSCGRGGCNELRGCLPPSLGVGWAVAGRL